MMQSNGGMVQPMAVPPQQQQQQQQAGAPPPPQQWGMAPPPSYAPQYQQAQQHPQQPMWNQQPSQIPPPAPQGVSQPQYPMAAWQVPASAALTSAGQPASADEIRTLWIGDLQPWMEENYVLRCFSGIQEVANVKLIRDKQTGNIQGYGFIEFQSHAVAEYVLQNYNGQMMPDAGQPFRLNWATYSAGEKRIDSADYTIFIGDLASDVTDYTLLELFKNHYTSVKGAKVVTDKITGRSKGYGFVRFADANEQIRAMAEMNGVFCSSRPMRVGAATNKKTLGGEQNATFQNPQGNLSEGDPNNTTIFVGGLDPSVSEDSLRQLFSTYGELVHVKIPVGKRCGFVQFANRACAEEALLMLQGTQLGTQNVRLSWGRSPSNKQQQQQDTNQWNGYYGYGQGYEAYGYAQPPQDPNVYSYGAYAGYSNYQQQPPQQ